MTLAVISITNRCNLRCKMCSIGQHDVGSVGLSDNLLVDKELGVEQWAAVLDRLGAAQVNIIGVEPLLYPDFDRLLATIAPGREIHVTTNGWFIAKWLDALKQHCRETTVSLDGLSETHDAIRGVKGSFERGLDGLARLREAGRQVRVSFAITPDNVADMLPLHRRLAQAGIPIVFNHFNYIHPDSCAGYSCTPVNLSVYDPARVDLDLLFGTIAALPAATFLPRLRTREELEIYYRRPPTRRIRTGAGCVVLEQVLAGTRFIIAADGKFIPGNRCWIEKPAGNAVAGDLPRDAPWIAETVADIRKDGLYPPCQRLCCAGKALAPSN